MEDLSTGQPVFLLEVTGRNDLVRQNQLRQVRCVLRESLYYRLPERFALLFPIPL